MRVCLVCWWCAKKKEKFKQIIPAIPIRVLMLVFPIPPKTKFVTQPAQERYQSFLRFGGACLQTLVLQLEFIHRMADGGRLWRVVDWVKFYPDIVLMKNLVVESFP